MTGRDKWTEIGEAFGASIASLLMSARALAVVINRIDGDYAYVSLYDDDEPLSVRLTPTGLPNMGVRIVPNVGSVSVISFANGDDKAPFFLAHSEIDKVEMARGQTSVTWTIDPPGRDANGDPTEGETNDELTIAVDNSTLTVKKDLWEFNGGTLDGLVIVGKLTDRLNRLQDQINSIQSAIAAHTHTVATTGSSSSHTGGTTSTSFSRVSLTQVQNSDYENKKITQ